MGKFLSAFALLFALTLCGCKSDSSGTGSASLRVVNNSSTTIFYLYVSPSSSDTWGPDQLGSSVIPSGGTFQINNIPCGRDYDLMIENSSRATLATRWDVFLACGSTFTWTLF